VAGTEDAIAPPKESWITIRDETVLSPNTYASMEKISSKIVINFRTYSKKQLNKTPTILTWKYKMDEMPGGISS